VLARLRARVANELRSSGSESPGISDRAGDRRADPCPVWAKDRPGQTIPLGVRLLSVGIARLDHAGFRMLASAIGRSCQARRADFVSMSERWESARAGDCTRALTLVARFPSGE